MAAPQFILWDSLWFGTRRRNYKIRRIRGRKEFKKKPGILPQTQRAQSGKENRWKAMAQSRDALWLLMQEETFMAGGIDAEYGSSGTPAGVRFAPPEIRGCRYARPPATFWQPSGLAELSGWS